MVSLTVGDFNKLHVCCLFHVDVLNHLAIKLAPLIVRVLVTPVLLYSVGGQTI